MEKIKKFFTGWGKFEITWLVLSTIIMIVLSLIWGDSTLALISGITGILGVVLAAKGKVSTYFFATINVAIYAFLTFNNHLYSSGSLSDHGIRSSSFVESIVPRIQLETNIHNDWECVWYCKMFRCIQKSIYMHTCS